jgi:hypothetical protein
VTATDLTRIEAALGIRLPEAYRRLLAGCRLRLVLIGLRAVVVAGACGLAMWLNR